MDSKTLQNELRQLSAIVDGWTATDQIPAIERDLALAKLQHLYELVRFDVAFGAGTAAPVEEPIIETVAVGAVDLDLAEDLSFGEPLAAPEAASLVAQPVGGALSAPEPGTVSETVPETVSEAVAEPAAEAAAEAPEEGAAAFAPASEEPEAAVAEPEPEPAAVAEPEPAVAAEPVVAVEPVPAVSAEPEPAAVAEPEPAAVAEPEPAVAAEPVVAVEPAPAVPAEPESAAVAESEPAVAAEPVVAVEPAPAVSAGPEPAAVAEVMEPEPAAAADAASEATADAASAQPVPSTLFGPEEAVVRHRHKQRVIMSLYDPDPILPSRRMPAPVVKPAPAPEDFALDASEAADVPTGASAAAVAEQAVAEQVVVDPVVVPDTPPQAAELPGRESESAAEPAPASAPRPAAEPVAASAVGGTAPFAVLGEAVNHDVQTLADTFAPQRDRADELASGAVDDLRRAIGINDKFLLIRDLFDGDGAACDAAIATLNGFDNLDDCMIHIAEHYAWNANSDGAKLLMALLERKFA